jgi:alpha-tubulin suppressor-like RCC1 family protein
MKAFVFGNNQVGQLGISHGDDVALSPLPVEHIEADSVTRIIANQNQTFVVLGNGSLLSCGENENGELARTGKRSWLHRVDALETFQIRETAVGTGFTTLLIDDGKMMSWGRNDMGQLCNGTRDNKEKPRVNSTVQEVFLQIACGATHGIGLTKTGKVAVWGGNRWGQLGDGQLTSSTKLLYPLQLRHRPVISVVCGENHCLAMTVGGNVYSWGENGQGQLGLSDTTNRLRPEQIKALRSMGAVKISAGRNHSLVISQGGLLLAFGSNNHGQCGLDSEVKIQPQPMVVERLRELNTVDVCGGAAHTMALCLPHGDNAAASARVFVMGLNSSGQVRIFCWALEVVSGTDTIVFFLYSWV